MRPQDEARGHGIPSVRFSTEGLRPREQFAAYREDAIGFAELLQPEPGAGCLAGYDAWMLGPMVVKVTDSPALDQRRTPAMARRDGLDHWLLTLPRRSELALDQDGQRMRVNGARPALLSCDRPYQIQRRTAEEGWVMVFVTRDAVPGLALPRGMDGVQALATPMGQLLTAHLRQTAKHLPSLTGEQVPALREATLALLRATLAPTADHLAEARSHAEAALRERLRGIIRARLGTVTFTPDRLCQEAGMSRTRLYRLFEPFGGVAAAIQAERLAQARRLLEAPEERRSIQQIGEAVGFYDASVFSRAFRRRYGAAPRDVREAALCGRPIAVAAPLAAARGFLDMVARMEA